MWRNLNVTHKRKLMWRQDYKDHRAVSNKRHANQMVFPRLPITAGYMSHVSVVKTFTYFPQHVPIPGSGKTPSHCSDSAGARDVTDGQSVLEMMSRQRAGSNVCTCVYLLSWLIAPRYRRCDSYFLLTSRY